MAKKKEVEDIISLTPVEHILTRPGMWIGATTPSEKEAWVLTEDTFSYQKITYTEGLLKICNEAIDNSIDIGIKTKWRTCNKINITVTKDTFCIEDNGTGIPVVKDQNGDYICVNAVCKPMTGSNFQDEDRKSIGANGVGIKGANIFSKKFECITDDGKKKMKIVCKNNLKEETHTESKSTGKTGTKITFSPDFDRFGVKEFRPELITMLKTRLKILSWYFPECSITFNKEKLNIKSKELSNLFPKPSISINEPNVYLCLYASEEPASFTYVNGISLSNGGNHLDYLMNEVIIPSIRNKVSKKFKNIKPADIRNRLGIVAFFKDFPNCAFNSQTKEKLTNSQAEVTAYLRENQIDLDKFCEKVVAQKEMLENITDLFKAKEELAEKKALQGMVKPTKKDIDSEKYYPPVGTSKPKYLMVTEGYSAFSGISPILGRRGIGYYLLKGKMLNVLDVSPLKMMANQECSELIKILGIDPTNPQSDMNYEKVVFLTDADPDGTAIAALGLNFFSKVAPQLIQQGRVCRLDTPLLIGLKGDKVMEYYFTIPGREEIKKNLDYFYLKGLGSWTKNRFDQVLEKVGGMENLLKEFNLDEKAPETLRAWFGDNPEPRKERLRGREFHIDKS